MVKGFPDEGITFSVASLRILRAPRQKIDGEFRCHAVQNPQ